MSKDEKVTSSSSSVLFGADISETEQVLNSSSAQPKKRDQPEEKNMGRWFRIDPNKVSLHAGDISGLEPVSLCVDSNPICRSCLFVAQNA